MPAPAAVLRPLNSTAQFSGSFDISKCDGKYEASTAEIATQLIYSIYWAITVLTTTGYGDITPVSDTERGFNIVVFIVGTLIYAMVVAHLEEIVSQLDVTVDIFKTRLNRVQAFLSREEGHRMKDSHSRYDCLKLIL